MEAALVLPVVLISILFFINFINVYLEHTCMQQALNNTAKKISKNAYLVYRFSGEEEYTEFINNLNNDEFENSDLIGKANTVIEDYHGIETNFSDTTDSLKSFFNEFNSFDIFNIADSFDNIIKKGQEVIMRIISTQKSSKKLIRDIGELGKKNSKYIILQTLYDEINSSSTSKFVTQLFTKYTSDLHVSVKKLDNINLVSTNLDSEKNGTFQLYLTYTFKNPFALLNNKSLEYSMINQDIRMFHTVTVSPFIGKSKTSLKDMYDIHHPANGRTFSGGWGSLDDGTDG